LESIALAGIIALWLLTIFTYANLPERIPTHFNFRGEVDNYGSRDMIWFAPIISLILFILLTFLNRNPHQFNYTVKITPANALRQYTIATRMIRSLKLSLVIIFIVLQWLVIQAAVNNTVSLNKFLLPAVILLVLVPIGYFIRQSIRNQ
ncbi:MAG: DUF1648 domain-containing protein, partial [Saprospiraceae bacterium]